MVAVSKHETAVLEQEEQLVLAGTSLIDTSFLSRVQSSYLMNFPKMVPKLCSEN